MIPPQSGGRITLLRHRVAKCVTIRPDAIVGIVAFAGNLPNGDADRPLVLEGQRHNGSLRRQGRRAND